MDGLQVGPVVIEVVVVNRSATEPSAGTLAQVQETPRKLGAAGSASRPLGSSAPMSLTKTSVRPGGPSGMGRNAWCTGALARFIPSP